MFNKQDFFVNETYSPPMGEKDIYIFPGLFGAKTTRDSNFFYGIKLKANRLRDYSGDIWEVSWNWRFTFRCRPPMNVFKVVNIFNKPSKKRDEMFRDMINHVFSEMKMPREE